MADMHSKISHGPKKKQHSLCMFQVSERDGILRFLPQSLPVNIKHFNIFFTVTKIIKGEKTYFFYTRLVDIAEPYLETKLLLWLYIEHY